MFPSDGNWHPTQALMDESQFTLNQTAFTSMSVLQSTPPRVLIVQNSWEIKTCSPDRPHTEVLTRVLASFSSRLQTRTMFGSTIRITIIPTQNGTLFSQNKCRICFFSSFIQLFFSFSGGGGFPDASFTETVALFPTNEPHYLVAKQLIWQ